MIKLIIDNREPQEVMNNLRQICGSIETKNLEHGDFHIVDEDRGLLMIIERKSISDLLASVNDGRYSAQKKCLLEECDRRRVYYLLEGYDGVQGCDETVLGCIISMMVRDDIKIFFTRDILDTCKLIQALCRRFTKNVCKYFGDEADKGTCVNIVKRKSMPSSGDVYMNMLMQIPGVSAKGAVAIASKYGNLRELMTAIDGMGSERVKMFREQVLLNGRKMSKTTVESLIMVVGQ